MWPKLVDYSKDECKQILRRMELEAYSSVVSTLRAQGDLNMSKRKLLQDLCHLLSITFERHQAEIRRAVNDEKLATIAYNICGNETCSKWAAEGRHLIPLLPRLVPQSPVTVLADHSANSQLAKNETLPFPSMTGIKSFLEPVKEMIACKRARVDSEHSPNKIKVLTSNQVLATSSSPISASYSNQSNKQSITVIAKNATMINSSKSSLSSSPNTLSSASSPRVVFMSSNSSTIPSVSTLNSAINLNSGISSNLNTLSQVKSRIVSNNDANILSSNKQIVKSNKCNLSGVTTLSSGNQSVTVSPGTRIFSTKSTIPQQVVVFPSSLQQKAITIPISQSFKGSQVLQASGTGQTALVYQSTSGSSSGLKTIPGTITIQTFKPSQVNKLQTPNLIIMPASKSSNNSRPITLGINNSNVMAQNIRTARPVNSIISIEQIKNKVIMGDDKATS